MTKQTGKMTFIFNSEIYSHLLSQHQPRIIKTEEENEKFLETVEELLSRSHPTPEEDALLELLVKLIEDFEDKHYQLNSSTPRSRILHLMEARGLEQADLVEILGSSEIVTKIMNNKLEITKKQAEALGKFFNVEPSLFIC
ncbi:transcriptional regulator [Nostoc sp. ATCC 53789]|uniref:helix-turn-helix domain-containing protein n=1 Tax=Nostoc sp. ATCC 53789 TaxID=76335 RepID=UPI001FD7E6AF|nr:transcriptional regulator [Nostoc sp. ATCC 53789]